MGPLILVVEDHPDVCYNIKLNLELNGYEVITAENGKKAIELLESGKAHNPDLIISDIMMPEMDGYDFFEHISRMATINHIPFIFLSAKSTPEDIRFGKMLGVDDYLTKPFAKEDLLAVIKGKLKRSKKIKLVNEKLQALFSSITNKTQINTLSSEECKGILLYMIWDDRYGPEIRKYHPDDKTFPFEVRELGNQLFNVSNSIYGYDNITQAEGILVKIHNFSIDGYAYFDAYPDERERFGEKQFMLGFLAPQISYFHSMIIKKSFQEISKKIKNDEEWNIESYQAELCNALSQVP
ncbi:MAG: response regulator transcription factor [Promethearchaeota archaeon]